jgi:hypothetical protein
MIEHHRVIATEIKKLLGWQFLHTLGAKNFIADVRKLPPPARPFLAFKIKGSPDVNYIRIILDESKGTYTVEFHWITGAKVDWVAEYTEIHCDDLQHLISEQTGINIS